MELKFVFRKIFSSGDVFSPMIIHSHGPRAGLLARSSTIHSAFSVYTEHRWDSDFHLKNKLNEFLQLSYLRKYNFKSDLIIAVSNSVKSFLLQRKLVPENRVAVIPNGIDLNSEKLKANSEKHEKKFHQISIGSVGNLNKQKGYEYLIEAMGSVTLRYPHVTLEIAGEGEERKNLESRIESLGLEKNVTLLGRRDDIDDLMQEWDIFVSSSVSETFGIVLLEAMKNGLPIVATRVGGVPDLIEDKKNGLLVPSANSKALEKAIFELIEHPARGAEYARNGKEIVKKYSWKSVIKQIEDAYESVAGGTESGK